ncbi:MAG: NAD(P)H-hydrate dehydratase [Candidatus Eutrophobiaceae bacterium]
MSRSLYTAAQIRELDRRAIEERGIAGFELMSRAGAAAWCLLRERWPQASRILVCCGSGNNAGDGLVVARIAAEAGCTVSLAGLYAAERFKGDAGRAWKEASHLPYKVWLPDDPLLVDGSPPDLIIDALFGTGLDRPLERHVVALVRAINDAPCPVFALDIPSGLCADTGALKGIAVSAQATVTFIGIKRGLLTAQGQDCTGELHCADLGLPVEVFRNLPGAVVWQKGLADCRCFLPQRRNATHKGDYGHVLLLGGDSGAIGAILLAGQAALRCGAGLASIATRVSHAAALTAACPELMVHGVEEMRCCAPLFRRATVLAIGPGLGQSLWAHGLLTRALETDLPLVVDADALTMLAQDPVRHENWVLSPHPGEAARLLGCASAAEVQADRYAAVQELQKRYGGAVILKGNGTVLCHQGGMALIADGNPGMASGGMGDVLTGVIAALLAQGLTVSQAAELAVCLHGRAADDAVRRGGQRGLLASDLLMHLRSLVN